MLLHEEGRDPRGTAAWLAGRPHLARHHHIRLSHPKVTALRRYSPVLHAAQGCIAPSSVPACLAWWMRNLNGLSRQAHASHCELNVSRDGLALYLHIVFLADAGLLLMPAHVSAGCALTCCLPSPANCSTAAGTHVNLAPRAHCIFAPAALMPRAALPQLTPATGSSVACFHMPEQSQLPADLTASAG